MAEMTLEGLLVAASGQQSVINGLQTKAKSGSETELILEPMFEALNRIVGWILRDYLDHIELQFTGRQRNRSWDSDHARLLITRDTHSIIVRVKDLDEETIKKVREKMNGWQLFVNGKESGLYGVNTLGAAYAAWHSAKQDPRAKTMKLICKDQWNSDGTVWCEWEEFTGEIALPQAASSAGAALESRATVASEKSNPLPFPTGVEATRSML